MNHFAARFALFLLGALLVGCSNDEPKDTPQKVTLYSIDGTYEPQPIPKKYEDYEKLQGYPILGKLEVKDEADRKEIWAALKSGILEDDGMVSGCFWPRHAVRTIEQGNTVDYVICFQCSRVFIASPDGSTTLPVSKMPKALLNKHLKAAGVPITPDPSEE